VTQLNWTTAEKVYATCDSRTERAKGA